MINDERCFCHYDEASLFSFTIQVYVFSYILLLISNLLYSSFSCLDTKHFLSYIQYLIHDKYSEMLIFMQNGRQALF